LGDDQRHCHLQDCRRVPCQRARLALQTAPCLLAPHNRSWAQPHMDRSCCAAQAPPPAGASATQRKRDSSAMGSATGDLSHIREKRPRTESAAGPPPPTSLPQEKETVAQAQGAGAGPGRPAPGSGPGPGLGDPAAACGPGKGRGRLAAGPGAAAGCRDFDCWPPAAAEEGRLSAAETHVNPDGSEAA
jgi:hypothetical protein